MKLFIEKALKLYDEGMTSRSAIAKELHNEYGRGRQHDTFRKVIAKAIAKHRGQGKAGRIPIDSMKVTGRSTLKDSKGNLVMEWTKTSIDKEQQALAMKAAIESMKEEITPTKPIALIKNERSPLLCNQYTLTDYHLGMYAWSDESGEDWDSKTAEELLVNWFEEAIRLSPNAKQAIFAQIGDFMHFDGMSPVTPASKHVLDADVRYPQLVRMAIRVMRRIINMLLVKYESVHVIQAEGNHDPASSVWLREMFHAFYENEPRVNIDNNPDPYYHFQWGKNCLFYHHSHIKNLKSLDTVFVSKFKKEFGTSEHVYAHTGHFHHEKMIETNLMILEQHPTLSAKDAYASRGGYSSKRAAKIITYHKEHGEVGRNTLSPEMIK
tara:strand:+ start:6781 stop:7920 length:1140 start_codon:yes stop_codon:yes gene_type:complete